MLAIHEVINSEPPIQAQNYNFRLLIAQMDPILQQKSLYLIRQLG